jgi:hypothetical protein
MSEPIYKLMDEQKIKDASADLLIALENLLKVMPQEVKKFYSKQVAEAQKAIDKCY